MAPTTKCQGRDGIGACPCCGTGVVFRRDILVSLGGQSYGSITEVSCSGQTTGEASSFSADSLMAVLVLIMVKQQEIESLFGCNSSSLPAGLPLATCRHTD
jgi:hypothetical protein